MNATSHNKAFLRSLQCRTNITKTNCFQKSLKAVK